MTHTPGPWSVVKSITAPICYIQSRDGQVATTYGEQDFYNHQLPNANLIAAAPDLLDALEAQQELERCRARCFTTGGADSDYEANMNAWHEAEEKAQTLRRAAIAKAKGRPPKEKG